MNSGDLEVGSTRSLHNNSLHRVIVEILKKENKPMRISEITREVLKKRRMPSQKPYNTVSAIVQKSFYIKKVERGIYKLVKIPKR